MAVQSYSPLDPNRLSASSSERARVEGDTTLPALEPLRGLTALFERALAAKVLIHSDDKTLSEEQTPPLFRGLHEEQFLWNCVLHPSANIAQIRGRQAVVAELQASDAHEAICAAKEGAYRIAAGFRKLMAPVSLHDEDCGRPLLLRCRHELHLEDAAAVLEPLLKEALTLLEDGCRSFAECCVLLKREPSLPLQAIGADFAALLPALSKFSQEFFLDPQCDDAAVEELVKGASQTVLQFGALTEFARISQTERMGRCEFNSDKPPSYVNGWNIVCPDSRLHPNRSPSQHPVTVYAGSNMSGKSETGLKQPFLIQSLAQALGWSSIDSGNFEIHDGLAYIDRTRSERRRGLSAFGADMTHLNELCGLLGGRTFVCFDEFGSTTSPLEQQRILYAVSHYLIEKEARSSFATHSENFITFALRHPDYGVYHFAISIAGDGKVKYSYRLEEGSAGAESVAIAEALNFDAAMLARVKAYLDGTAPSLATPRATSFPPVVDYTPEERERLKGEAKSGTEILLAPERDRFFMALTHDPDLTRRQSWWFSPTIHISGDNRQMHKRTSTYLRWAMLRGSDDALIEEMLLRGPKLESAELLERQRTFSELAARDCYDELSDLQDELAFAANIVPDISGLCGYLLKFNRYLAPFGPSIGQLDDPREGIELALAYLELNQKALGAAFPRPDLLEAARELHAVYHDLRELHGNWRAGDLLQHIEMLRATPASPEQAAVCLRIMQEIGEEPVADRALTLGEIHDLFTKLYHHPRREQIEEIEGWAELSDEIFETVPNAKTLAELCELVNEPDGADLNERELEEIIRQGYSSRSIIESFYQLRRVLEMVRAPDPALQERVVRQTAKPFSRDDGGLVPTRWALEHQIERLMTAISWEFLSMLPPVSAFDLDLAALEPQLGVLVAHQIGIWQSRHVEDMHGNFGPACTAALLRVWCSPRNALGEFLDLLRSYDSVPLHQLANSLADSFAEIGQRPKWPHSAKALPPDTEELPRCSDVRMALELVKTELASRHAGMSADYQDLARRDAVLNGRDVWARYNSPKLLERVARGEALDAEQAKKAARLCRDYLEQEGGELAAFARYVPSDPESLRIYLAGVDEPHPFVAEIRSSAAERQALERDCEAFCQRYRQSGDRSEENAWSRHQRPTALERAETLYSNVIYRASSKVTGELQYDHPPWSARVQSDLNAAVSMARLGRHIRKEGYAAAHFNSNGNVVLREMRSMLEPQSSVPQSLVIRAPGLRLLSGPNMSGKTYHEKTSCLALCSVFTTGHGPALEIDIPQLDGAYFLDRITGKDDLTLSSAGMEFKTWGLLLRALRGEVPAWFCIDEAFSTLPPRYQEAFSVAGGIELLERGHYGTLATHHHDAINVMDRLSDKVSVWHFQYEIDETGKIHFARHLTPGHAPSEALPVMRALGVDKRILELVQEAPFLSDAF